MYITGNIAHIFGSFTAVRTSGTSPYSLPQYVHGGYVKIDLTTQLPVGDSININYPNNSSLAPGTTLIQNQYIPGSVKSYYLETDISGNTIRTHLFGDIQYLNGHALGTAGHLILDASGNTIPPVIRFTY